MKSHLSRFVKAGLSCSVTCHLNCPMVCCLEFLGTIKTFQIMHAFTGLLKMDRRYREMLHLRQLKNMYKEKFTNLPQEQKKKLTDVNNCFIVIGDINLYLMIRLDDNHKLYWQGIKRCRNFLKKDDKVRTELNLPLHSFRNLRRIKVVRDSVPIGTQWLSFSTNPKSNSSSSCAIRTKKRKVDHKKSNRSPRLPTNGNQIRLSEFFFIYFIKMPSMLCAATTFLRSSESLPLPLGNVLDGTFGKNHWMIPFNFGLYNQMADMMNQITCSGGYWPSYGNGFYHHRPFRGHSRNYSNGWRYPLNRNTRFNPLWLWIHGWWNYPTGPGLSIQASKVLISLYVIRGLLLFYMSWKYVCVSVKCIGFQA